MAEVSMDTVTRQLVSVLHGAFEGPPEPWSYFTDNRPDAGLFGTLALLSTMGGAIGAIAHAAYHLGAIRQKVAALRVS